MFCTSTRCSVMSQCALYLHVYITVALYLSPCIHRAHNCPVISPCAVHIHNGSSPVVLCSPEALHTPNSICITGLSIGTYDIPMCLLVACIILSPVSPGYVNGDGDQVRITPPPLPSPVSLSLTSRRHFFAFFSLIPFMSAPPAGRRSQTDFTASGWNPGQVATPPLLSPPTRTPLPTHLGVVYVSGEWEQVADGTQPAITASHRGFGDRDS